MVKIAKTTMTNDGRLMDSEINFINELWIASCGLRIAQTTETLNLGAKIFVIAVDF